jgi:hypothetical protein
VPDECQDYIEGVGLARSCAISASHSPAPLRYVWHHIQPKGCGGQTVTTNLIELCDTCHYAVHALLYQLKVSGKVTPNRRNNKTRVAVAVQGYDACVAAGTVAHIPNEGSASPDLGEVD